METSTLYLKYTYPLLGIYPKDSESAYHINSCISMLITVHNSQFKDPGSVSANR